MRARRGGGAFKGRVKEREELGYEVEVGEKLRERDEALGERVGLGFLIKNKKWQMRIPWRGPNFIQARGGRQSREGSGRGR